MIGKRLQEIRRDHGDTQKSLAEKLRVSKPTVQAWELGKSSPSHDMLVILCRMYQVSADYLLGLTDTDPAYTKRKQETLNADKDAAGRAAAIAALTEAKKLSDGYTKEDSLAAGDTSKYMALVVYMPTTVGNEANHNGKDVPQINLGIKVEATQQAHESDSFDNEYDADASAVIVEVDSADALKNAKAGNVIKLINDITLSEDVTLPGILKFGAMVIRSMVALMRVAI